jgi:hypothetical protein
MKAIYSIQKMIWASTRLYVFFIPGKYPKKYVSKGFISTEWAFRGVNGIGPCQGRVCRKCKKEHGLLIFFEDKPII